MGTAVTTAATPRVELLRAGDPELLSPEALAFLGKLGGEFRIRRHALLEARAERQRRLDAGERPDFLEATRSVRESQWSIAAPPKDLLDRRVEITGPVDRKMIINALNSGARVFMADFEDSTAPAWDNLVRGQKNLIDAVRGSIRYVQPGTGKVYELGERTATLMVRPRGWHLDEAHALVEERPLPGALFDFGLFFFHNARRLIEKGSGPYFYLAKLESHLEARLWNDVFQLAQDALGVPRGTIRATVLIETLPAAFEMDEILYELREHSAGLNCGRWDYIFSFIKKLRHDPLCVLPDRAQVTMDKAFLDAYVRLLIQTCHRRGAHAMGGMAAQIPIKDDREANERALEKVRADKRREAGAGHDGTWVAHPGLVPVAQAIFDEHMPKANQLERKREDVKVTRDDLLRVPEGTRSEAGLRHNLRVALVYLESWLRGVGCVPIDNLMEDAATAEICRAQVWQWLRHGAALEDGRPLTRERVTAALDGELARVERAAGAAGSEGRRFREARALVERLALGQEFEEFLTLPAYGQLEGVAGDE